MAHPVYKYTKIFLFLAEELLHFFFKVVWPKVRLDNEKQKILSPVSQKPILGGIELPLVPECILKSQSKLWNLRRGRCFGQVFDGGPVSVWREKSERLLVLVGVGVLGKAEDLGLDGLETLLNLAGAVDDAELAESGEKRKRKRLSILH